MVAQGLIGLNLQLKGGQTEVGLRKVGDELRSQHGFPAHILLVVQLGVGIEFRPGLWPGSRFLLLQGGSGTGGSQHRDQQDQCPSGKILQGPVPP